MSSATINKLRKFRQGSKLRISLLNIMVKKVDHKDTEDLRAQFDALDKDKSGAITTTELKEAI